MEQPAPLRLEIGPDDLPRLRDLPAIAGLAATRPVTRRADRTFFDTTDRQLWSAGVVLEVRRSGRRHLQIARPRGDGRSWESPLASAEPDPSAVADPDVRQLVTPLPGGRLAPVLRLELRHMTRRLAPKEGEEIVLAVHHGRATGDGAPQAICEIELTVKAGPPVRLFELARAIHADIPARVATEPLEGRLLRLAHGDRPPWRKAIPLDLPADATVEEALILILRHCLDHLTDNEACTRLDNHPEGVHQMRVALRRMRSALRVFRPLLPAGPYRRIDGEVRWLTQGMAEARDLDVFAEEIVGPVATAFPGEAAFAALLARLAAARERARDDARRTLADDRFTRFLLDVGAWMAARGWREQPVSEASALLFRPITELAAPLLSTRFRKVRKRGRRFAELTPEERHQLRIDVKKLRYAADFFSSLYGRKRVRAFTATLQKLQDGLGYMNDVTVARALVERLEREADAETAPAIRHAGAILMGWHTRAAAEAGASLAADVEALVASKPFWAADAKEPPS